MQQKKILDIAISAGSVLLRFGAETYRVEDTIRRICESYGLKCEAFVLPTGVFVSVEDEQGASTICKRIPSRTVDLTKIAHLNDLSRRIERDKPEYNEVMNELDAISACETYSGPAMTLCFSLTAFAYALLFGGNYRDGLCAMFVGALLYMVNAVFSKDVSFPFITYFAGGLSAAVLGSAAASVFPGTNAYVVTVGAVTNMLPGVALINGIRDLLYGDSVSGLTKFGEAIMIVAVIAAGSGIGLALWIYGGAL